MTDLAELRTASSMETSTTFRPPEDSGSSFPTHSPPTSSSYMNMPITLSSAPRDLQQFQHLNPDIFQTLGDHSSLQQHSTIRFSTLGQDYSNYQIAQNFPSNPAALANSVNQPRSSNTSFYPEDYGLVALPTSTESSRPRSCTQVDVFGSMECDNQGYPPSFYQLHPQKPQELSDFNTEFSRTPQLALKDCDTPIQSREVEGNVNADLDIDQLSTAATSSSEVPLSGGNDQSISGEFPRGSSYLDDPSLDKEEPYAKLIYRALLDAPDHTMILKDIYSWFKHNTDKASNKEAKGWQNSIRHNLSMNGAFQKVDQPARDDTKKGFMWMLTESAIREGVKSTTRYRSKVPNKRSARSSHVPAPQRQASGAKGGQAAKKAARLRRSQRFREGYSAPMQSPSVSNMAHSLPIPRSTGYGSIPGSEFGGQDSGSPSSPYYFESPPPMGPSAPQRQFKTDFMTPPPSATDSPSYPSTPEAAIGADAYDFLPIGSNEPLFYDSPESTGEPMTPPSMDSSSFSDMQINPSSMFESSYYGGPI